MYTIIDGNCPGWIHVDDRDDPRTALLWDHAEGELYLIGPAEGEGLARALNDCIRRQIHPYAQAHLPDFSEYTLYCDPDIWGDHLDVVLAGLNPMQHYRKHFALVRPKIGWPSSLPDGYTMLRMDESLLARCDLEGIDTMRDWVLGSWRSAAGLARVEIGFCLVHGDELVSWCASEFTSRPVPGAGVACEVGIYTAEAYRRRGFATLTASATVACCLEQGLERIGWHCWEANAASAATAEKVGFELTAVYPVYNGSYNQFDNLLLQAHYATQAGRMDEAVTRWERAFEMWETRDPEAVNAPHIRAHPGTMGWCYYAAARARAGWDEWDLALDHLNKALDNGWTDVARLRADQELASLHGTEGWQTFLIRLDSRTKTD